MEATLHTLCGCRRDMQVTWPPPERIDIPLNRGEEGRGWLKLQPQDPVDPDPIKRRTFKLHNHGPGAPRTPQDLALYYEEAKP
jgi:hypothetical protein